MHLTIPPSRSLPTTISKAPTCRLELHGVFMDVLQIPDGFLCPVAEGEDDRAPHGIQPELNKTMAGEQYRGVVSAAYRDI